MCALLEVSKSGFYEWRGRPVSATGRRRDLLAEKVRALFAAFDGTYGYRRIHAELVRAGERAGAELVRALMRDLDLVPVQPRPFRTTTEPDRAHAPDSVDLVRRDFAAERPGIKVVGEHHLHPNMAGLAVLASLIDCCTREVIGYAMADHLRTELVLGAVDMAIRNRRLDADCIMHSDRGTQYTSSEYRGEIGRAWVAAFGRADRSMLGQCARGIVFREPEE